MTLAIPYAVGEVMRSHMADRLADTPLLGAKDPLHACYFCTRLGGDENQGICDCYHDKLIFPPRKVSCKYWAIHAGRCGKVPRRCWGAMLWALNMEDVVGKCEAGMIQFRDDLQDMLRVISNLPEGLATGLHPDQLTQLEALARNAQAYERQLHAILTYFDKKRAELAPAEGE